MSAAPRWAGVTTLGHALVVVLLACLCGWAAARTSLDPRAVVGVVLVLLLAGAAAVFWRLTVYLAFVVLFAEGFARNLLDTPYVLLLKDALLAVVYLRVFGGRLLRGRRLVPADGANILLALFALVVLMQAFNPWVLSLGQAAVGMRGWLYYVPLYYVAQELCHDEAGRRRFTRFFMACAAVICAVAMYQYVRGFEAYAALGEAFRRSTFITAGLGGDTSIYRPNATFAWPTHFALFLALALLLNVAAMIESRGRERVAYGAVLVLVALTTLIQGQRTLFVLLPPLILSLVVLRKGLRLRFRWYVALAASVVVIDRAAGLEAFARIAGLLLNEQGVVGLRVSTYVREIAATLETPFGFGVGATAIGTRYVSDAIPLFVELPIAKVLGELGVFGFAIYVGVIGQLMRMAWAAQKSAAMAGDYEGASLAAAVLSFEVLVLVLGYELAVMAVPFWFLAGVVGRLGAQTSNPQNRDG